MSILSKSFLGSLYQLISIYDQSEKTREKFISPIKKLFKKLTKSGKPLANNNIDTKVIKKINTILELENIEFKDGFLEEKIKKLVEVLQSGNIAFIDSAVHRATMPQPSLDNSEVRTAQEGFFDNKSNEYYQFLIKEFFDLMHKVVEKFIDEESKVIKRRPINLERNVSIDSDRIVVKNSTIRQRRMNALARLFDSDEIKSLCIAVALVKGHFIIGVNTPFTKDKNKLEENINSIEKHLFEKAGILQSFFKKVTELENINDKSLESLSKDTFTKLESLGFSTRFLYDKYVDCNDRFKLDLDKITRSLLISLKTNGTSGFSNEERETLLTKKPLILFPDQDQEKELEGQIHADQIVLIATLKALKDEDISQLTRIKAPLERILIDGIAPQQPIPIGIQKLSCGTCFANIYAYESLVSCYGTSGFFLNNSISTSLTKKEVIEYMEEGTAIKTEILEDFNLRNDSSTNQYVIKASHVPKSYKTHADDSSSEAESLVVLKR